MRGQFIRGDGLILPNNITLDGSAMILGAALRNTVPTFYFGLVSGNPANSITLAGLSEPTIGFHGYARIAVARSNVGWPSLATVGAESVITSLPMVWAPATGAFDKAITRIALFDTNVANPANKVYALSSPLPTPLTIDLATLLANRTFQYQIFL